MSVQSPPLLSTKLQAPAVRRELVGRGSLVNRLHEGATARMTVVTAPPGWGKTTLLAAWRLVEGGRRPFAWLSLDRGDNDPARFWSYVVEALRTASYVCRDVSDENVALTFGFFEGTLEELREIQRQGEGGPRSETGPMAPHIEEVLLDSSYEVLEELTP